MFASSLLESGQNYDRNIDVGVLPVPEYAADLEKVNQSNRATCETLLLLALRSGIERWIGPYVALSCDKNEAGIFRPCNACVQEVHLPTLLLLLAALLFLRLFSTRSRFESHWRQWKAIVRWDAGISCHKEMSSVSL